MTTIINGHEHFMILSKSHDAAQEVRKAAFKIGAFDIRAAETQVIFDGNTRHVRPRLDTILQAAGQ